MLPLRDVFEMQNKAEEFLSTWKNNRGMHVILYGGGALAKYISTPNDKFQPMNANFGILPELEGKKIKDKKERYRKLAERSLENLAVK